LIRRATPRGVESHPAPVDGDQRKHVAVEARPLAADVAAVAEIAARAVEQGATVLVLRNTVADCVATQRAVEARLGADHRALLRCDGLPVPHHGRFAAVDRRVLDRVLEAAFAERGARVAVTTQTAEQSLDLDADLLVTDLAPIDVLLQRIGRLHRHRRNDPARPTGFESARVVVLTPATADLADALSGRGRHGLGTVYPWLTVLQRTWEIVVERPTWVIPDDNRALVEDVLHAEARAELATRRGPAWAEADRTALGEEILARHSAADAIVQPWTEPFGRRLTVDDEHVGSRFADDGPDRRCPLPAGTRSPISRVLLSELGVPCRLWRGTWPESGPRVEVHDDHIRILGVGDELRYDRFGLHRVSPSP
jgi:CRISPR-associated endonuclease/helicase Cas3